MRWFLIFLILGISLRVATSSLAEETSEQPVLTDDHCLLCHKKPARDIETAGMAHKEFTSCVSCHDGHPPEKFDIIPACNLCHAGQSHHELEECLSCHINPHRPLDIRFLKNSTEACITCHEQQGQQLEDFPSLHSQFDCTSCHESHADVPECLNCHHPHSEGMGQDQCLACHNGHSPLAVSYGPDLPSSNCTGCHEGTSKALVSGGTKHQSVGCTACHLENHGSIPQCTQCHQPHSRDMSGESCRDCHQAHAPLPVAYPTDLPSSGCAACHEGVATEMRQKETLHSELACATCHQNQHGVTPVCTLCHAPHSVDMGNATCTSCHAAHRPAPVAFTPGTPSDSCAACHPSVKESLEGNRTMHSELLCVSCHQKEHGVVPACATCHGVPHRVSEKFPQCTDCHISAHDLIF